MTKISLLPLLVVLVLLLTPLATAEIKNLQITADRTFVPSLFTFKDLIPKDSFNHSFPVTTPDLYNLIFANCQPETQVTMHVTMEIYNLVGATKDYLPVGQTQLPLLYFAFAVAYLVFLGVWVLVCVWNRPFIRRIHLLMGWLILMKALNLICAAEDKYHVKVTGTSHGWDVWFYIFQFIRVMLSFIVIVLIATGWSIVKPALHQRERVEMLMIVIPLQVAANVALVVVGVTGPFFKYWVMWNQAFLLFDIPSYFMIIYSIGCLIEAATLTPKGAMNLAKLTLFKQFYTMVFVYVHFMKVVVFCWWVWSDYKYLWANNAGEEIATLAFFSVMFHMFRPVENTFNLWFLIDHDEEEAAASTNT